jgi:hypothetical protein
MAKYYEIICDTGVIGCTADYDGSREHLLHAVQEDQVIAFGLISKADFKRFGDETWVRPISKRRYKPTIRRVLDLKEITKKETET